MKPVVWKSVLSAILSLVIHFVVYIVLVLLLGAVFLTLAKVPVIGKLLNILFIVRKDSPGWLITFLSALIGMLCATWVMGKICADPDTKHLAIAVWGWIMVVFYVPCFVVSLFTDASTISCIANLLVAWMALSSNK